MEISGWSRKWIDWIKKYKYALLVLVVGILLMCWPGKSEVNNTQVETTPQVQEISMEQKLETILSQMQGAGKVKVMLTVSQGERTVFQYDEDYDQTDTSNSIRKETVIITDGDRNEQALITQLIPPVYLGAVILCQGADQPAVKLAVVEAVSKITGLGSDKICVLKMK